VRRRELQPELESMMRPHRTRLPAANPVPAGSRYRYSKRRYRILFRLLDRVGSALARVTRANRCPPLAAAPRSILVVQLDHIGDAVLSTGMLRVLHDNYPNAAIDVLAAPWNAEVFRGNPAVRQVLVSERNWQARQPGRRAYFAEVCQQSRRLRRFNYELGIDPRGDFLVACMLWLAGIPRRLGWDCGGGDFLFTDVTRWDGTRHEAASRVALLKPLGVAQSAARPALFPAWADYYAVRESLATISDCRSPIIVLHVGAGTAAKQWPIEYFARLVERLENELEATVILVGAADDQRRAQQLSRWAPRVINWTGRLSLMQLSALLAEADLFIGGDSGPAHVAAAMAAPSVVLFSGTNRADCWRPVGERVIVLRSPVPCSPCHLKSCPVRGHPCMGGTLPWEVFEAARSLLAPMVAMRRGTQSASGTQFRVAG
jgi:lipopolysaccharide heptosyltransferase II